MQGRRKDAAARDRVSRAKGEAAQLIRLEELDVAQVIDWANIGPEGLGGRAGNAQIEGLLAIGAVASGNIAADEERKVIRAQPGLHHGDIHAFLGKNLRLDTG